jgi:hypothetical protein
MVIHRAAASGGLVAAAMLHAAWGAGSAWPFRDRAALADAVIGAAEVPGPGACFAVSGALGVAGALAAGWPARYPGLRRAGVSVVAAVLAARGGLGLAGRTGLVSPASVSARFTRLDRRVYSPLCLTLAGLAALSARPAVPDPMNEAPGAPRTSSSTRRGASRPSISRPRACGRFVVRGDRRPPGQHSMRFVEPEGGGRVRCPVRSPVLIPGPGRPRAGMSAIPRPPG